MKKHLHRSESAYPNFLFRCLLAVLLTGISFPLFAGTFVPGEGGSLPVFPPVKTKIGTFAGFLVTSSDRHADWFNTTYSQVEMSFPYPQSLGAESLTLQYKKEDGSWAGFIYNDEVLTTTSNNFSLKMDRSYQLRLLINGGPKNGYVSNEQTAVISSVNTYISSWGIDESMYLSNVMSPWAGCGIKTNVEIKNISDNSVVEGGLTIQWYRVNPVNFEMSLIPGQDSMTYITTAEDAGYRIMMSATGDGVKVGGFIHLMNSQVISIPNKCFIDGISTTGFKLNLYKKASALDTSDLILYNNQFEGVQISSITQEQDGAVYRIDVPMTAEAGPYTLMSRTAPWKICTVFESPFGEHLMEMVSIKLDGTDAIDVPGVKKIKAYYEKSSREIRFSAESTLTSVQLYSMSGALLRELKVDLSTGGISASDLSDGFYMLRFVTPTGVKVSKIRVLN